MFYINVFFVYSFLGFIFENIVNIFTHAHFRSGLLYGPWTFIYGFAIYALMIIDKILKKFKLDKWLEIFLFYVCATFVMTLIELSGGLLIEKLFHTNLKFNIGHYIALEISFCWGFFATIVNYLLRGVIDKFIKKIPRYITVLLILLFIIDIFVSLYN